MRKNILGIAVLLIFLPVFRGMTQPAESPVKKRKKGTLYVSWGYNKDWFSRSDIHFYNPETDAYDFVLENVKAKDKPGLAYIFSSDLSVPQYVYRLGYYFEKYQAGLEISFDHTKYIMLQNQVVHLKGRINERYYDQDTLIHPAFVQFEHTNGANFLMLNLVKRIHLHQTANKKFNSWVMVKIGAGPVVPKTDVTLFGQRLDNCFHIAGYVTGIETGFRLEMLHYFFLEPSVKGTFANFNRVLTVSEGKAHHHFWTLEAILSGGFQLAF